MQRSLWGFALLAFCFITSPALAEPLTVSTDFEGGSAREVEIDQATRTITFMPGGDPTRGWPCWWYLRVEGITPGEKITLRLRGSTATVPKKGSPLQKPLNPSWAMPSQATFSTDGRSWQHTEKGQREQEYMIYTFQPDAKSVYVAWGPPYTPKTAAAFVKATADKSPHATATELCRSRQDRAVPMLHVMEGDRPREKRFGVWIQARQHAWESGSSWVAQGFGEWLLGHNEEAAWLRQHAEIYLVPIMDVDNTATGNGGKDAEPQDHNRDWSDEPHWNEIKAAQKMVGKLIEEGRMDVFVDLHNPAPGDPTFFYILPSDLLGEPKVTLRNRFMDIAYGRISRLKPLVPMSSKPKPTGPSYHPLWRQISATWVSLHGNPETVSVCLETIWNSPRSTTEGYRSVGGALAASVREYLAERPERK
jgi:hypothetical protein